MPFGIKLASVDTLSAIDYPFIQTVMTAYYDLFTYCTATLPKAAMQSFTETFTNTKKDLLFQLHKF